MHLTRKRAEMLAYIQHTNSQDNLPETGKKLAYQANRAGVAERFPDPAGQKSLEVALMVGHQLLIASLLGHQVATVGIVDPHSEIA